jgi:hypothetical protein
MTNTTFDGRDPGAHTPLTFGEPDADQGGLSTLDLLRVVAAETVDTEPYVFENPLGTLRFTCDTNIEQKSLTSWQRAALPPQARSKRGGVPDLSRLDPVVYFARAIAATCTMVEVRRRADGEFTAIVDQSSGDLLTFKDPALLSALGGLDATSAVRNAMNGAEWAVQREGTVLLEKAGYIEGDGDGDEDPQG